MILIIRKPKLEQEDNKPSILILQKDKNILDFNMFLTPMSLSHFNKIKARLLITASDLSNKQQDLRMR